MEDRDALLVLNAVPGLGPVRIKALVDHFGLPTAVLEASYEDLSGSGIITPAVAVNIVHFPKDKFLSDEYNLVRQKGAFILTAVDDGFPEILERIPGAPLVLYGWGDLQLLHTASDGMVGSRVSSHYGLTVAARFAGAFAKANVTVVSGLARGIDTASHRGCLGSGGKTVAVIGCGLLHVYPKENKALMQEIGAKGLVISEMPMNTPPIPVNFPRRNRIISGLSLVTVVVEAGLKSGALITAGYALEQGRDVFAVPANIDYTTAQGSNVLIRDGARVALGPEDVLAAFKEQLHLEFGELSEQVPLKIVLSQEEARFLECLSLDPVHIDELALGVESLHGDAAQVMLNLELKGLIRQLPGKFYVKV